MTTDERVAQRRAALTQQLAAIPRDGSLPASTTRDELAVVRQQRADLERKLASINAAVAAVTALGSVEDDERWRDHLTDWRQTLVDERMQIKSPIRGPLLKGREQNLALSIKAIDRGLQVFDNTGYELTNTRLGELMLASGYTITDADASVNYSGRMPWFGSLPEVEKRIATLATKRESAEAHLDAALMTDEDRAAREAESKLLRDALNALVIKMSSDGTHLVPYRNREAFVNNDPLDPADMSPLEREAFTQMEAAFMQPREQPVVS